MDAFLTDYSLTAGIVAGAAALVAILIGLLVSDLHRGALIEAKAGLGVLHTVKWGDLAHYMVAAFRTRGFESADYERKPGDGGFDLLLRRGQEHHLLQCKHGGTYRVDAGPVEDLVELMRTQGATGGTLATTGRFAMNAHRVAKGRSVELLEGEALWRLLKPHLPDALIEHAHDDASRVRRRKGLNVLLAGLTAAATVYAGAWYALRPAAAPEPEVAAVEQVPAPAAGSLTLRAEPRVSLPESEQVERRLDVIEEIAAIAGIVSVDWASKSTLAVALRGDAEATSVALASVCDVLGRYEELRFSRIQVRPFESGRAAESRVRWHQCR